MLQLPSEYHIDNDLPKSIGHNTQGWSGFTGEVQWFIYDFFKYELNGYEKLLFYSYFVQGFTLEELSDRFHVTFQRIAQMLKVIEKRLRNTWKNKDNWRARHDSESRDK